MHVVTGEFGIPTVPRPSTVVGEPRSQFARHSLLNREIATHKNNAQAIFVDNGEELKRAATHQLFAADGGPHQSRIAEAASCEGS